MKYYLAQRGEKHGPYSEQDIERIAKDGGLADYDHYWASGMDDWRPVSELPAYSDGSTAAPSQPPASSTYINPRQLIYAGFWKRVVAYFIDYLLILALLYLTGMIIGLLAPGDVALQEYLGAFSGLLVSWWYYAFQESSSRQATVGKRLIGMRVVDLNGERISFLRATGRYFGQILSGLILGIGYLMAGFTEKRQCLHDMLANCLVVNEEAAPEQIGQPEIRPASTGAKFAIVAFALLIPVTGILAAISLPAYQDYVIRAEIAKGAEQAEPEPELQNE